MPKTLKAQVVVSFADGTPGLSGSGTETGNSIISVDQYFAAASTNTAISLAFTLANLQAIALYSDKGCTIKTNGIATADVQTISISGTPTGGSFSLTFGGQSTILAYNAAASAVQAALQALSSIGSGNVTCTGGPLPGTPVACTFAGTKATGKQAVMTAYSGGLTGGTSPTVSVAHTTSGQPSDTITLVAGEPYFWKLSTGLPNPFFSSDVTTAFVTCTSAMNLKIAGLSS
jgi:hypothetical protein